MKLLWQERRDQRAARERQRAAEGVDCTCGERVLPKTLRRHQQTEKCRLDTRLRQIRAEGLVITHRLDVLRRAGVRVVTAREWRPPAWGRQHMPEHHYTERWAAELAKLMPLETDATAGLGAALIRACIDDPERRAALEAALLLARAELGGATDAAMAFAEAWGLAETWGLVAPAEEIA